MCRFSTIEPSSAVVRVDDRSSMSAADFADYVSLFADTGWQHLDGSRHGGAQYFASFGRGENVEIFWGRSCSRRSSCSSGLGTASTCGLLPVLRGDHCPSVAPLP
ncbi:MAG: DUF2812 domain-containing protein [Leucobacter sp.]